MKVFLIVGGALLGVLLLCGGGILFVALWVPFSTGTEQWNQEYERRAEAEWKRQDAAATSDQQHAKAFLDYWVTLVRLNNLDAAYKLTTAAYQARTSRAQFDQFVQKEVDLRTPDPNWGHGLDGKPGTRFSFVLFRPGPPPYELRVAKEGTEWKMDEILVK
jgi:hypothetical protein